MAELDSIGLLELSSVATGYLAQDAMLKAAPVELLLARTICSGKYIVVVGGDVAATTAAVDSGAGGLDGSPDRAPGDPARPPSVFPAISMAVDVSPDAMGALGVIETFSARASSRSRTRRPRPRTSSSSGSTSRWPSAARASSS